MQFVRPILKAALEVAAWCMQGRMIWKEMVCKTWCGLRLFVLNVQTEAKLVIAGQ